MAIFENKDINSWLSTLNLRNQKDIINLILGSSEDQRLYEILNDTQNRGQISLDINNFRSLLGNVAVETNTTSLANREVAGPSSAKVR